MSERNSWPASNEDCEFSSFHELVLTQKILEVIHRFSRDEQICPSPFSLRDTMLAVSALLHLEGVKIASAQIGHSVNCRQANRRFTQAASERFEAVMEAAAVRAAQRKH